MLISTVLLIANLASLVFNGYGFMSFWWNVVAYPIEIFAYVLIVIIIAIIAALAKD